jgi:HD-like signal output (HDOD) protein
MTGKHAAAGHERRQHTRFDLSGVQGRLRPDTAVARAVDVSVHNVSAGGMLVEIGKYEAQPPVGKRVQVSVLLNGEPPTTELPCRVARALTVRNRFLLGLQFCDIERPEYAKARCALLCAAMLQTSALKGIGQELGGLVRLAANPRGTYADLSSAFAEHRELPRQLVVLADSGAHGVRRCGSVDYALRMLGLGTAVNAALVFAVAQAVPAIKWADETFWIRSLTCAHLAEHIRRLVNSNAVEAFPTAFLHDLGVLLLRRAFPIEASRYPDAVAPAREALLFGLSHEQVNAIVCRVGRIPTRIADVLSQHHLLAPNPDALAATVYVADALVEGTSGNRLAWPHLPAAMRSLGLAGEHLAALRTRIDGIVLTAGHWYSALVDAHAAVPKTVEEEEIVRALQVA